MMLRSEATRYTAPQIIPRLLTRGTACAIQHIWPSQDRLGVTPLRDRRLHPGRHANYAGAVVGWTGVISNYLHGAPMRVVNGDCVGAALHEGQQTAGRCVAGYDPARRTWALSVACTLPCKQHDSDSVIVIA